MTSIRMPIRSAGSVAWTAGMLAGVIVHEKTSFSREPSAVFDRWMRTWCRGLLRINGVETLLTGAPVTPASRARLVISNHRSPFDILILLTHFGGSFLSRADLATWPLFGYCARKARTIFVERGDKKSGSSAVRGMRQRLEEGGTVLVFPEGTTLQGDEVREFRAGAFAAVRGLDAEILPVGFAYESGVEFTEDSMVDHMKRVTARRKVCAGVCIGESLSASDDVEAMVTDTRAAVQACVQRAREVCPRS